MSHAQSRPCPVCTGETTYEHDNIDVGLGSCGPTCYEHIHCDRCGYDYEFSYGSWRTTISEVEYGGSYSSPEAVFDEADAALTEAKKRWQPNL